jgi:hypothetical protein
MYKGSASPSKAEFTRRKDQSGENLTEYGGNSDTRTHAIWLSSAALMIEAPVQRRGSLLHRGDNGVRGDIDGIRDPVGMRQFTGGRTLT